MEKPDAQGFVNITWPSKNIPHGGVFHTRIVESSAEHQKFLKVLLEESKLTIAQRRKSALKLREQESEQPQPQHEYKPHVRPRTSRRRSLSCIRESGVYEMDPYKPIKRGEDREKLKERLAKSMQYGDSPDQMPPPPPPPCKAKPAPKLPTAKEKWNELLTQIRERAEWLAEMEDLGHAGPHREIVHEQIAERLRALDALGIDSQCSSARSTASGFSTLRSREPTVRSNGSAAKSVRSIGSQEKLKDGSARKQNIIESVHAKKEENVTAYRNFSPLQYTPRRRV